MERIKLSFETPVIDVREDEGIVVCKLNGSMYNPFDVEVMGIGVARLKDGDKFDKNIGIKIATAKAESNAYRKVLTLINPISKEMRDTYDSLLGFQVKAESVIKHNKRYIRYVDTHKN